MKIDLRLDNSKKILAECRILHTSSHMQVHVCVHVCAYVYVVYMCIVHVHASVCIYVCMGGASDKNFKVVG